jgi:hypothetical protein
MRGTEWFAGDANEMKKDIDAIVDNFTPQSTGLPSEYVLAQCAKMNELTELTELSVEEKIQRLTEVVYKLQEEVHGLKLLNKSLTKSNKSQNTQHITPVQPMAKTMYECPRCAYRTQQKNMMRRHLYSLKKQCSITKTDVTLTDNDKEYILANQVWCPQS